MKIEYYRPKSDLLKKYIAGYYFVSPDENPQPLQYWTFPNNYFITSVNINTEVTLRKNEILIDGSEKENVISNFVSRYINPIKITFSGVIHELTFYFEPLGINHFVNDAEQLYQQENAIHFAPSADYLNLMKEILRLDNLDLQRDKLEAYWLNQFVPKDLTLVEQILTDVEADLKIEEIATKHQISRQYINKIFRKFLGKSPSEYRKIYRFRNAIGKQKDSRSLTELSYESLFYDQSHLIKDFKQLTNVNPFA
ncbi:MAG: AraC family transcriptional regulator, partial [Pedobacter sp.]